MKKIFITLAILICTLASATARDVKDLTGSLLWKVSGNGLTSPSYILGTHHMAPVSFLDSIPGFTDAWKSTDVMVGEMLMKNEPEMQAKIKAVAMMPAGETYHKYLSPAEYEVLDNGLKEVLGMGLDRVGSMKPGILSTLYTIALYAKLYPEYKMGQESIDQHLQKTASDNGKTTIGLETVEDQIYALLYAESTEKQIEALLCTVKNNGFEKEETELLNRYYFEGKLIEMHDVATDTPSDPCPTSKAQKDALLKDRNNKWVDELPAIMRNKPSLIAVGALHLPSRDGILYQLSKLGYTVEAVK